MLPRAHSGRRLDILAQHAEHDRVGVFADGKIQFSSSVTHRLLL
jgi:hypothetical protein